MEIQWVMLAKEIRTNSDSTMCIDGIFHHINAHAFPDKKVDFGLAFPEPLILRDVIYDFEFEYDKNSLRELSTLEKEIITYFYN